ncbi:MAG: 30S ribosomal protein S21 [Anaerolineae bacterium]|nr:MAG: 30S ribosomal protein S21 [Anaerolineae bacterium]
MAKVHLRDGEPQMQLFRRFRKAVTGSGVMGVVRKKRWFISESEQRRIDKKKAIRRLRRKATISASKVTRNPGGGGGR